MNKISIIPKATTTTLKIRSKVLSSAEDTLTTIVSSSPLKTTIQLLAPSISTLIKTTIN